MKASRYCVSLKLYVKRARQTMGRRAGSEREGKRVSALNISPSLSLFHCDIKQHADEQRALAT